MSLSEEFQDEIRLARLEEERETRTLESEIEDYAEEARDLRKRLEEVTASLAEALEANTSLRRRAVVQSRRIVLLNFVHLRSTRLREALTRPHNPNDLAWAYAEWKRSLDRAERVQS